MLDHNDDDLNAARGLLNGLKLTVLVGVTIGGAWYLLGKMIGG